MRTQGEHIRTLQRRVAFLKAREHRNSYDQAELGALEWALVNLPPAQQQQQPGRNHWEDGDVFERIAASKNQPAQQEPVACVQDLDEVKRKHLVYEKGMDWKDPLYTSPPAQRKPLTDEEINQIADEFIVNYRIPAGSHYDFVRAIEAKLKERNQ